MELVRVDDASDGFIIMLPGFVNPLLVPQVITRFICKDDVLAYMSMVTVANKFMSLAATARMSWLPITVERLQMEHSFMKSHVYQRLSPQRHRDRCYLP